MILYSGWQQEKRCYLFLYHSFRLTPFVCILIFFPQVEGPCIYHQDDKHNFSISHPQKSIPSLRSSTGQMVARKLGLYQASQSHKSFYVVSVDTGFFGSGMCQCLYKMEKERREQGTGSVINVTLKWKVQRFFFFSHPHKNTFCCIWINPRLCCQVLGLLEANVTEFPG